MTNVYTYPEMNKIVKALLKNSDEPMLLYAAARIEELEKAQWISVEEQLPESGKHVLACCKVKWLGGGSRAYICDAFYAAPKSVTCGYSEECSDEYDEETDEYYLLSGWYEVIKNWDDYSCIVIPDFVTHWMPLPDLPEGVGKND